MDTLLAHGDTSWFDHYSQFGGIAFMIVGLILVALIILAIRRG